MTDRRTEFSSLGVVAPMTSSSQSEAECSGGSLSNIYFFESGAPPSRCCLQSWVSAGKFGASPGRNGRRWRTCL